MRLARAAAAAVAASTTRAPARPPLARTLSGGTGHNEHATPAPAAQERKPLFDARAKALQKARAALSPNAARYDYLRDHMAAQVVDRLHDVARKFPRTVDLFCGGGHFLSALRGDDDGAALGVERVTHLDVHDAVLARAAKRFGDADDGIACDAAVIEPGHSFAHAVPDGSADLVVCAGGLHWVSDLRAQVGAARAALRPDGLFLAVLLGGDSLHELRVALQEAEHGLRGRVAPRVSPMVRLNDAAALLGAAGLALATADTERVTMWFDDLAAVTTHVRAMGEANALSVREPFVGRDVLARAAAVYDERFGVTDEDGRRRVPLTVEMIHMIGWEPAASQPRALRRGSAPASLAELSTSEDVPSKPKPE